MHANLSKSVINKFENCAGRTTKQSNLFCDSRRGFFFLASQAFRLCKLRNKRPSVSVANESLIVFTTPEKGSQEVILSSRQEAAQ